MTNEPYAIERHRDRAGTTIRLVLIGGLTGAAAHAELHRSLRKVLNRTHRVTVVIDLERVGDISSECVRIMLLGYTRALRGGHGFAVENAHGHLRRALAAVGLCAPEPVATVVPAPPADVVMGDDLWFDEYLAALAAV
jgi:anti-anti-sigma regulatory factor